MRSDKVQVQLCPEATRGSDVKAMLVVMTDPVSPDRDTEYNKWYNECHLPDVLEIPGYVSATRYRAFEGRRGFKQEYLALYQLEVPDLAALQRVSGEHMRRIADQEMRLPPRNTLSLDSMRAEYYTAVGPRLGAPDSGPPAGVFLPCTDPVSVDREPEYRAWYQDTHLPEVLMVPGFEAATLYHNADINMLDQEWVTPHKYMALYELTRDDKPSFKETMIELQRRIQEEDHMYISPALGSGVDVQAYERISERAEIPG